MKMLVEIQRILAVSIVPQQYCFKPTIYKKTTDMVFSRVVYWMSANVKY